MQNKIKYCNHGCIHFFLVPFDFETILAFEQETNWPVVFFSTKKIVGGGRKKIKRLFNFFVPNVGSW